MPKKRDANKRTASWTTSAEELLLTRMYEHSLNCGGTKPNGNDWQQWALELKMSYDLEFDIEQLRSKRDRFKKTYETWQKLIKHTGLGWDSANRNVLCDESVWEQFIRVCYFKFGCVCIYIY